MPRVNFCRVITPHGSSFTIGDESRNVVVVVVVAKKKRLDSNGEGEHGFEGEDKGLITLSIDVNLN